MMNWREWVFNRLSQNSTFTSIVPIESIYGSGSIEQTPSQKPFIVLTFGVEQVELSDGEQPSATSQYFTLWAHDNPGDYQRLDQILSASRMALVGPVVGAGAICAKWMGDSGDIADDTYGTIVRNSEYRLVGRQ
jgi:diadenosine tetraphosphatase ApaH/serine/threonine PP2A family protein phosphatase